MREGRRFLALLAAAGTAEGALLVVLARGPEAGLPGAGLFAGAFAAYACAALLVRRGRAGLPLVWTVGVALRLSLLPFGTGPWRALHEAPEAPAAHLVLGLVGVVGGLVVQLQLLWLALDLATGWILVRVARASGRSGRRALLLYLWSPLLVLETAWLARPASLALVGLAGAVALARPVRSPAAAPAGVALGWSWLAAPAAPALLAALPALVRRQGLPLLWGFLGAGAAVTGLFLLDGGSLLPALLPGGPPVRAVSPGGLVWASGASGAPGAPAIALAPFLLSGLLSGSALVGAWAAGLVAAGAWATFRGMDTERALLWVVGTALLLVPVTGPWDALLVLPLAALRGSAGWLAFTGAVGLAMLAFPSTAPDAVSGAVPGTVPGATAWTLALIWLPTAVLLVVERLRLPPRPEPLLVDRASR